MNELSNEDAPSPQIGVAMESLGSGSLPLWILNSVRNKALSYTVTDPFSLFWVFRKGQW